MSDRHSSWSLILLLTLAACGGGEPERAEEEMGPPVPEAGPPLDIPPLTDAELMGVDRAQVVLNLPWSGGVLAKNPAPDAPRATLRNVASAEGPTFDRIEFTFATDAPFPGYRVVWNDRVTAGCAGEAATQLPAEWTLLVAFEPATARVDRGSRTVAGSLQPGLPTIERAAEICDAVGRLVWALSAADSVLHRVVELRDPPRLLVDLMHPSEAP